MLLIVNNIYYTSLS